MLKWNTVQWQDVLTIKNGKNQKKVVNPNGNFPIYGSGGIMGFADDYLCDEGTTIIGRKGSINNPLFVSEKFWNVDTAFGLCAGENLNNKYLYYFCLTYNFLKHNKATTLPSLTKADLLKIKIPLPPLPTQKKIAAILDAADAYRQKTKALINKYDQLAQSLFWDMFGDNTGTEYSFKDIADNSQKGTFSNGPFGSDLLTSELTNEGIPVVYIRDLRNGKFNWISNVFVTPEKADYLKNCQVLQNDVLIAKVGDPPGVAAIYSGKSKLAIITQDVIRIRVNTSIVSPEFIQFWFNSNLGQIALKPIIVEGTRKRFGLGDLKKSKLFVPSIEKQNEFTERIQLIEKQKQQAQTSLQKAEEQTTS